MIAEAYGKSKLDITRDEIIHDIEITRAVNGLTKEQIVIVVSDILNQMIIGTFNDAETYDRIVDAERERLRKTLTFAINTALDKA